MVNPDLLDNHQTELADEVESRGLMAVARSPDELVSALQKTDWDHRTTYPDPDATLFLKELGSLIRLD